MTDTVFNVLRDPGASPTKVVTQVAGDRPMSATCKRKPWKRRRRAKRMSNAMKQADFIRIADRMMAMGGPAGAAIRMASDGIGWRLEAGGKSADQWRQLPHVDRLAILVDAARAMPVRLGDANPWTPYHGSRGGHGWQHSGTGDVRYVTDRPGAHETGGDEQSAVAPVTNESHIAAYQAGHKPAAEALLKQNAGLVYKLAKQFARHPDDLDDLQQEARIALLDAAKTFDPIKGFQFSMLATKVIANRLSTVSKRAGKRKAVWGQTPEDSEGRQAEPSVAPDELPTERDEQKSAVLKAVEQLPDNIQSVVKRRYGLDGYPPESATDIAERVGLSKQRISQMLQHAEDKMRGGLQEWVTRLSAEANPWIEYRGPRGGKGWKHSGTGDVRYGGDRPGAGETGQAGEETPSTIHKAAAKHTGETPHELMSQEHFQATLDDLLDNPEEHGMSDADADRLEQAVTAIHGHVNHKTTPAEVSGWWKALTPHAKMDVIDRLMEAGHSKKSEFKQGLIQHHKGTSNVGILESGSGEGDRGGLPAGESLGGDAANVPAPASAKAGGKTGGKRRPAGSRPGGDVARDEAGGTAGGGGDANADGGGTGAGAALPGTALEQPQTAKVEEVLAAPPTPKEPTDLSAGNWRYHTRDFAGGGLKTKFRNNIAALETARGIRTEGRDVATPAEQAVMSKFIGWGQFPALFNDYKRTQYGDDKVTHDKREEIQAALDPDFKPKEWEKEQAELKAILSPQEWADARASTLNAHFTHPDIVDAHWEMAKRLGYTGGRFLETSAGIGYYLGQMPAELAARTRSSAVELESSTGEMLKLLYPASQVKVQGFEKFRAPNNFYDLVASNVPFHAVGPFDPNYNKFNASLHDYFFLKSADLAKPGGLIMHITSTGTLDKGEDAIRKHLAKTCDIVAAYRLPGDTHKENAGTSVVTDMIILRKRLPGEKPVSLTETPDEAKAKEPGFTGITTDSLGRLYHWKDGKRVPGPDWVGLSEVPDPDGGDPITINSYFAAHPENVLGRLDRSGTMYSGEEKGVSLMTPEELSEAIGRKVIVEIDPENKKRKFVFEDNGERVSPAEIRKHGAIAFKARLQAAIDRLPEGVFHPDTGSKAAFEPDVLPASGDVQDGGFTIQDGKLYRREGGGMVEVPATRDVLARIGGMLAIRDVGREINRKERMGKEDPEADRAMLNQLYDAYVEEFGTLHDRKNAWPMRGDPDRFFLSQLEKWDAKEGTASKADMFTKRTAGHQEEVASVDNVSDGLQASLHKFGGLDLAFIAGKMGKSEDDVAFELIDQGIAFHDPQDGWKTADIYLSGNVRRKVILAKAAAEVDPKYKANVAALEKVQPEDVDRDYGDGQTGVVPKLGAHWIPPSDIAVFAKELLDARHGLPVKVDYIPGTATWKVAWETGKDERLYAGSTQAREVWGTGHKKAGFMQCFNAALNGGTVTVRGGKDRIVRDDGEEIEFDALDDEGKPIVNKAGTADANAKVQEIRDRFKDWLWEDEDRTVRLLRHYNDNLNNIKDIDYNGQHQTFPGMNPTLLKEMFPHIKDFVWQVVTTGGGLAAHEVGTGKTTAMIASAMELRRLGLARKPAIVCLKSNIAQITKDCLELYPGAKILSTAGNFDATKRQEIIARMATGDYDICLMTHDQMNKLKMSPEVEAEYIRDEIAEIVAAKLAAEADDPRPGNKIVKALETAIKAATKRLETALNPDVKDKAMTFEESGIDQIFVDECFPGDTVVETERGPLTIGKIVDGELAVNVLSCNPTSGDPEYKPVTAWFRRPLRNYLVRVTHERGSFVCTPNHNIWTEGGYVHAGSLTPAHRLRIMDNGGVVFVSVIGISAHQQLDAKTTVDGKEGYEIVYDIEVADNHNYFADGVNVSNSHAYKSLRVYTKQNRIKGIPTGQSQRATTMLMRARWLQKNNGGRGVVFATGTPISNTMAELFNVQRYLQSDELKERGLEHFDAWLNTFGDITTRQEFTVAGTYKPASRLSSFSNIPELMHLARLSMDVVRADDLKRPDGSQVIKRPTRKDYSVVSPVNDSMKALMSSLADRAEALKQRQGPPQPGDDNMLVICTDGRKGAVDMRLLDDTAPDDPDSKTNQAVRKVLELHKANPTKAQIIFSDIGVNPQKEKTTHPDHGGGGRAIGAAGTGSSDELWNTVFMPGDTGAPGLDDNEDDIETPDEKGGKTKKPKGDDVEQQTLKKLQEGEAFGEANLGSKGKFRLYDDIIDKLVAGGIPRDQIADFSRLEGEARNDAQQRMRNGDIRVAIGSTQKLGTGTNVQDKVMAMHHLDVPWVPASVEQRDGRGWRHGNENKEIGIYRYVAAGSLDQKFWDIISQKMTWQNQVLNNRQSNFRSRAEDDSEVLTAEQLRAEASGDPRMLQQANLEEEVKVLRAGVNRHERDQTRMAKTVGTIRAELPPMIEEVKNYDTDIEHLKSTPDFEWVTPEIPGTPEVRARSNEYDYEAHSYKPGAVLSPAVPAAPSETHTKRADAEKVLNEHVAAAKKRYSDIPYDERSYKFKPVHLGTYRGLDVTYDPTGTKDLSGITLTGKSGLKYSAAPSLQSIEYVARNIPKRRENIQSFVEGGQRQIDAAEKNLGKTFAKQERYAKAVEELDKLNDELFPGRKKPAAKPKPAPQPQYVAPRPQPVAAQPPRPVAPAPQPAGQPTHHVLSGNTYVNKDVIKRLGGKWDGPRGVWKIQIANTEEGRRKQAEQFKMLHGVKVEQSGGSVAMSLYVAGYDDPRLAGVHYYDPDDVAGYEFRPMRMGGESNPWQVYQGPRGGKGWKHSSTGDIRYGGDRPGAGETGSKGDEAPSKIHEATSKRLEGKPHTELTHAQFTETLNDLLDHPEAHGMSDKDADRLEQAVAAIHGHVNHRATPKEVSAWWHGMKPHEKMGVIDSLMSGGHKGKAAFKKALVEHHIEAANPKAGAPWDGGEPKAGNVYNAPVDKLHVDPSRFQFKIHVDAAGVTDELKGVKKWNPDFAGVVSVWQDPANGRTYVVNGHHRYELASRLGIDTMAIRYVVADTAQQARAVGALVNMAEGRGTAVDAAKFLRDTGKTVKDIEAEGISLRGTVAGDAVALTSLSNRAFNRLVIGQLDQGEALSVARNLKDPDLQDTLFRLLEKRDEAGKDTSAKVIVEMAREMAQTPKTRMTGKDLFGDIESDESLFVPRNELKSAIRQDMARELHDFAAVASKRRAAAVTGAGNTLNVDENKRIADEADRMLGTYDTLVNRRGPISDAVNVGAAEYAKAKKRMDKDGIRKRTVEAVRAAVLQEAGEPATQQGGVGQGVQGGQGGAGSDAADAGAKDAGRSGAEPGGVKGEDVPAVKPAPPAGLSDEERSQLESQVQMYRDGIATKKDKGDPIPQEWLNGIAKLQSQLAGQEHPAGSNAAKEVFGHPSATSNPKFANLIPMVVTDDTDLSWRFKEAQKHVDELQSKIGKAHAVAMGRVPSKPAEKNAAKEYLASRQATEDETYRDMLRNETLPELQRLEKLKAKPAVEPGGVKGEVPAVKPTGAKSIRVGQVVTLKGKNGIGDMPAEFRGYHDHAETGEKMGRVIVRPTSGPPFETSVKPSELLETVAEPSAPPTPPTDTPDAWLNNIAPAEKSGDILHTIPGEANTEAVVSKHDKGYAVALRDKDAGETLPTIRIHPTKEGALKHAQSIVGPGETKEPTESIPPGLDPVAYRKGREAHGIGIRNPEASGMKADSLPGKSWLAGYDAAQAAKGKGKSKTGAKEATAPPTDTPGEIPADLRAMATKAADNVKWQGYNAGNADHRAYAAALTRGLEKHLDMGQADASEAAHEILSGSKTIDDIWKAGKPEPWQYESGSPGEGQANQPTTAPPQTGLFGDEYRPPAKKAAPIEGHGKEKQESLFQKKGLPGQKNLFADRGVPDDMVQKQAAAQPDKPKINAMHQEALDKLLPSLTKQMASQTNDRRKESIARSMMDGEAPDVQRGVLDHLKKHEPAVYESIRANPGMRIHNDVAKGMSPP